MNDVQYSRLSLVLLISAYLSAGASAAGYVLYEMGFKAGKALWLISFVVFLVTFITLPVVHWLAARSKK